MISRIVLTILAFPLTNFPKLFKRHILENGIQGFTPHIQAKDSKTSENHKKKKPKMKRRPNHNQTPKTPQKKRD